jgi:propanediol dehydratase small subunit
VDSLTLEAVLAGEVSIDDVRIHPETLIAQAEVAEQHGNPQLGANFRRAAELATLDDERVLAIYEALRPGRSGAVELMAIAEELRVAGAPRTADLVAEAALAYQRRGLAP